MAVYTNNPPAGAFRGFGVTQSAFATECNINIGRNSRVYPLGNQISKCNWTRQVLPNGQIADEGTALKETLLAVKEEI